MTYVPGLEGVVAAQTGLSLVDGENGRLVYRGYWARDLAKQWSFEDVAYLLWYGSAPDAARSAAFRRDLASRRVLPAHVAAIIDLLPPDQDMMSVLRTAVSAMGVPEPDPTLDQAATFLAVVPTIIAHRHARLQGKTPVPPDPSLSHVANYLYMLQGVRPTATQVRALEAYLILAMEHGMNASTFAARVVTSTRSDMASALTAAIGAMKGPLHGGAPSAVMDMLDQIGDLSQAEPWIRARLEAGERLMGFGHRIYKTEDPRAAALRDVVRELAGADAWFALAAGVEEVAVRLLQEYKPGRRLYTNVEYWAAAILRQVGMPPSLYTATFTASRVVGWTAHILEQAANNRLIRPQSEYVGPLPEGALVN
ncbi:MAG: citrate synthase/methylcitrate synthase [Firmicutes bacterium]|nr:citrate synthase/methylcitrate synthase [Bacillota bacterium]